MAVVLTAASGGYGYHRDELYFRMLRPAWGYVDQPPLTPLLARLFSHVADEPWALRIPATIAAVGSVYIVVLITRELGGGPPAQSLCAWGYAFASLPLLVGHALITATIDMPVWPAVALFVIRAQLRHRPQWWLAAGLVVGVSMYNKLLIAVLLVAIAAGLLLVGPRRALLSKWVAGAAVLAVVVGFPNLLYQPTHDWPQLSMGRALADNNAGDVHTLLLPFLFAILGPLLVPIWIAGIVSVSRRRDVRFLAAAFPVLLVIVFVMGSQFYYPFGLVTVLYAAGCVPVARWMTGRRRALVITAVAVNALVSLVIALPIVAASAVGDTPVPAINQIAADSIGWPRYVAQIADAYRSLPPDDRARAVVVASNYGEAGATDRFGPNLGLPAVYSGQNGLYYQARPPDSASIAVFVGGQLAEASGLFETCSGAGTLDNGLGVDNEEQGEPIAICTGPIGGWRAVWPALRHED